MPLRFSRDELKRFSGKTLPDLISHEVRLLFVGINPGLRSVAVQAHFAPRGNRFYPALFRAGITDRVIDASSGFAIADREYLLHRGIGITSLVERATASADELTVGELVKGIAETGQSGCGVLAAGCRHLGDHRLPEGLWRAAGQAREAVSSPYPASELWVVPNPSGRNAHASLAGLAAAYGEAARAAGIRVDG